MYMVDLLWQMGQLEDSPNFAISALAALSAYQALSLSFSLQRTRSSLWPSTDSRFH